MAILSFMPFGKNLTFTCSSLNFFFFISKATGVIWITVSRCGHFTVQRSQSNAFIQPACLAQAGLEQTHTLATTNQQWFNNVWQRTEAKLPLWAGGFLLQCFPKRGPSVPTVPIDHPSEHAAGAGADPQPHHGEGQPEDGGRAQVGGADSGRAGTGRFGRLTNASLPWVRLCSVDGVAVSSAAELETGRCYVAVGTERFKKLPYVELLLSKATERYRPTKRARA